MTACCSGLDDPMPDLDARLRIVEAERSIARILHEYADFADRRDWSAWKSLFDPESTHRHDRVYAGRSHDFAEIAATRFLEIGETQHLIGNVIVDVDIERGVAKSRCSFLAYHRIPPTVRQESRPKHIPGSDEVYVVGGRYLDRFALAAGAWKITHRQAVHDWEQWLTADVRGFEPDPDSR